MKKQFRTMIAVLLTLSVLLAACKPEPAPTAAPTEAPPTAEPAVEPTEEPEPEPEPIVLADGLGVEVVLDEPAQMIVSISPSTTEILYAVGAGQGLIGRDSNSLYPEEAASVEDLGSMWEGVPVEDILALEPDLVLMGENISPDSAQQLRDLGLAVFWQANPLDFEGLYNNLSELAQLCGTEEETAELISSLQDRVAEVESALAGVDEIPLVFYELDATDPTNPWTAGAGTFISYVIGKAGGKNLGDVLEGSWAQISSEELIAQDPDIILLSDALFGVTVESVAERAGWGQISAVVNGNVLPFDPNLLSIPGPRLVNGLEEVARIIHPDLFELEK